MSVLNALKWSFLGELASKAIQPVVFIILARLLTPEDFGVMTAALMVIGFSQIFWEAGMGKAIIQRQSDLESAANAAFWINIVLGICIASMLYLFAKPIARIFFQDERVIAVLRVMTLQVLLGALCSVQIALLQKDMQFKKLFWVRFATVSLPGLASIPLAWYGFGFWALVAGTLSGQLVQVLMLWWMSDWRPGVAIKQDVTTEMTKFGVWVGATGMMGWFYTWADSLVVGHYLGSQQLGLYRTGNQVVLLGYTLISMPFIQVFYSWLATKTKEQRLEALSNTVNGMAIVFIPLSILIYGQSDWLAGLIFGGRWAGIDQVIAVMALSHGLSYLLIANGEIYKVEGNPQYETYPMIIGLFVFVPLYIISIQYGLYIFLISRLIVVFVFGFSIHSLFAMLKMNLPLFFYMRYALLSVFVLTIIFIIDLFFQGICRNIMHFLIFLISILIIYMMNYDFYMLIFKRFIKNVYIKNI